LGDTELDRLRYPVGRFEAPQAIDVAMRNAFKAEIERLPVRLRDAVSGLTESQLLTPYRDGGWTPHQVVHHVADSHLNAFIRFKLALTQDTPTICVYDQTRWAQLADTREVPIQLSLTLLDSLHARWLKLLQRMSDADFAREYMHPEQKKTVRLDAALAMYAWHCRHHVAHITSLRDRNGW
jgi:hypothetical protein